jgi:hypothetical protein
MGRQGRWMAAGVLLAALAGPAAGGDFRLFGLNAEYRLTLGYALAMRVEAQDRNLIDGPVDTQQVAFTPFASLTCPNPPCLGDFGHTGLPTTINFDDGNRDFRRGSLLNNRVSAYGELHFDAASWGLGDVGAVLAGAAHYDEVFTRANDHDNAGTVNRMGLDSNFRRVGPVNQWTDEGKDISATRARVLDAYAYGVWPLGETMSVSVRAGRHLAAWGESLFFPGIVTAQGPFDATKANVPGVEVKEILLPVNQVSSILALTPELSLLGYYQLEYEPTEVFQQGDFFSPADLVGPGASFGYGAINPLHPERCDEPVVTDATTGAPAPPGTLCLIAAGLENQPEYIMTPRTPDKLPGTDGQWGLGATYQLTPRLGLGVYHLRYHSHTPYAGLNLGYARVGDANGQEVTTEAFNVRVPVSYTLTFADNVEMNAVSFSSAFWVLNVSGEVMQRRNVDVALESTIAGVVVPWTTRGTTTQAQVSALFVSNPKFLYDELNIVGEVAWLQVDEVQPVANQDGVCMSGTKDCDDYTQKGSVTFYDERSWAWQALVLPKARNVWPGWDLGTPVGLAWLVDGMPAGAGAFGALYGEGDQRASLGLAAQYVQNLELALTYYAYFGDTQKNIGNSVLRANPFADHDYVAFTVKYSL